jgi:hypothetical protein
MKNLAIAKLRYIMVVTIQYSCKDTNAFQACTVVWQKINWPSTHTKSRSFYVISNALQRKAYHLHEVKSIVNRWTFVCDI